MMLRVEFIAEIIAELWFDAKVPSPTELFRNWIFGALKCGKKMKIKGGLPGISNLFLDKRGKVVLAGFGAALGTPLMYWSMGQTAWKALDTWSTIINTQAFCENPEANIIFRDGEGRIQFAGSGGIPFYTSVYDPFNWGNHISGFFEPPAGPGSAYAYGTLHNLSPESATIAIKIWNGEPNNPDEWEFMQLGPAQVFPFSIARRVDQVQTMQVRVRLENDLSGILGGVQVHVNMFTYTDRDDVPWNRPDKDFWDPDDKPYDTCQLLYEAPSQ